VVGASGIDGHHVLSPVEVVTEDVLGFVIAQRQMKEVVFVLAP